MCYCELDRNQIYLWAKEISRIFRLKAAFLIACGSNLWGCSGNTGSVQLASLRAEEKEEKLDPSFNDALAFRTIFYRVLGSDSKHEYFRMSLVPDKTFIEAPQSSFKDLNEYFREKTPEKFYKYSTTIPPVQNTLTKGLGKITGNQDSPTLIIMPGFSSEFSYSSAFAEAVENEKSSFFRYVKSRIQQSGKMYDQRYSLNVLGEVKVPLEEVVRFGSIDDENGRPLVKVIFLFPELGSLETFGRLEDLFPIYKRRLDKFFELIGPQKNIYISGHSRGAAAALDFIANSYKGNNLQKKSAHWMKGVKGFVGINGALYGSHYAEAYFTRKSGPHSFRVNFAQMKSLEEDISIPNSITNRNIVLGNLIDMGIDIMFRSDTEKEEIPFNFPDISVGLKRYTDVREMFAADAVLFEYPNHIKRVKKFARAFEESIRNLRHTQRLSWWRNHELPTHLKYYTFAATLPGPIKKEHESPWRLSLLQAPSLGRHNLEYLLFRRFYYEYYEQSRISLNDGLVGFHESTIWPRLHQKMNPRQKPYLSQILGLYTTHHTAMVYGLLTTDDYEDRNPFPRRAFLAALGHFLSRTETIVQK